MPYSRLNTRQDRRKYPIMLSRDYAGSKIHILVLSSSSFCVWFWRNRTSCIKQERKKSLFLTQTEIISVPNPQICNTLPSSPASNITARPSITEIAPNQPIKLSLSFLNKIRNAVLSKHFRKSQKA